VAAIRAKAVVNVVPRREEKRERVLDSAKEAEAQTKPSIIKKER
jgi:hypothetical protein